MVVLIDPLDLKIHIRKYVAGQLNNNIIEIALKTSFDMSIDSEPEIRILEQGSPNDGFSSDFDEHYLTTVVSPKRVATQDSPIVAAAPSMQSTVMEPISLPDRVATPLLPSPPSLMALPGPSTEISKAPENPSKRIKLELDRNVARDLAKSLSAFATMLQIDNDSSGDSFEVVPEK